MSSDTTPARAGSIRELLIVALPLVLSSGSVTLMHVLDRIFLTRYSVDALAAAMPAGMLHWLVLSLAFGTVQYVNTFVAQYQGAGRPDRVAAALWQGIYFSLAAGLVLGLLAPLSPAIFRWVGHSPVVQQMEAEYFAILCLGSGPILLGGTLSCFYSGRGLTMVVMWVNLAGSLLNIAIDYVLIFGWGPIPAYGIRGAAIGTVIGELLIFLVYAWLIHRHSAGEGYVMWPAEAFDRELFSRLLRFGLPNGLSFFADVFCFSVFILLVGKMGEVTLAATNLAFNLNALAFLPMLGVGTAISTLVGQRIGEKRPELAARTTWRAFLLAACYMGLFAVLFVTVPDFILDPYAGEQNAAEFALIRPVAIPLLRFVAIYSLFDAMAIVFGAAIRGAGDTRFALIFSLISGGLIMVLPTYLAQRYYPEQGLMLAWSACTLYVMSLGVGFLIRFQQGAWKSMRVIEDAPPLEPTIPAELTGATPAGKLDA